MGDLKDKAQTFTKKAKLFTTVDQSGPDLFWPMGGGVNATVGNLNEFPGCRSSSKINSQKQTKRKQEITSFIYHEQRRYGSDVFLPGLWNHTIRHWISRQSSLRQTVLSGLLFCVFQLASRCVPWREHVDDFHLCKGLHIMYFPHFHVEPFLQIWH